MVRRAARWVGRGLLFAVIALLLAVTIVPFFLDRIYYDGPESGHFDGARFFNPGPDDTHRPPGGGGRGGFLWRQATGSDDRPAWPDSVPVQPAKPPARVAGEAMLATWIGHATVLVQTQWLNILTDPIWSERAGPFGFGPGRVATPGVRFADLPRIDLVLLSHNHYDHMDLKTLKRLWDRDRPRIVTSLGNDAILRSAGIAATARDWGQQVPVADGVAVTVNRNHHWGSRWFRDRNRALWSSFLVTLPRGGNLFFAGDTGLGDGRWADDAARAGQIRLALIPIGAFRFSPGEMGTGSHIGPVDAVEVFRRLGAWRGIAIHWGTFRLSYEAYDTPPRLLRAAVACGGIDAFPTRGRRFGAVPIGRPVAIPPIAEGQAQPPVVVPPAAPDRAALLRCLDTPAVRALR